MKIDELNIIAKDFFGNYGNRDHNKQPFGKCEKGKKLEIGNKEYNVCTGTYDVKADVDEKLVINDQINNGEGYYAQWWVK